MSRFFVAGLINVETTLAVEKFPISYNPVNFPFFGVQTTVSGVGYNISKALTVLGNDIDFASIIGGDDNAVLVRKKLAQHGIPGEGVISMIDHTAQSVILYDPTGRRQIYTDLKDIQDYSYPVELAKPYLEACDLAVICNINFARPLLSLAKQTGKQIATDVHTIANLDDDYNQDYMRYADILFLSDESLPDTPEVVARDLEARYQNAIIVIGLGSKGALLSVRKDGFVGRFPAVKTREVINTIGAGDALFSSFLDRYMRTRDPYRALQAAMVFASYKIGEKGAADGFLDKAGLDAWLKRVGE
jgi:ribokinase